MLERGRGVDLLVHAERRDVLEGRRPGEELEDEDPVGPPVR